MPAIPPLPRLFAPLPLLLIALALAFVAAFGAARAGTHAGSTAGGAVFAPDGVAIRGFDPVAYFTEARPREGSPAITHAWNGVTWRFATEANRDAFAAAPERYAPAYGGFCAYAASEGYTAPVDPFAWKIVDGRLFLNYDQSVQRDWEKNAAERIRAADANWPKLAAAAGGR